MFLSNYESMVKNIQKKMFLKIVRYYRLGPDPETLLYIIIYNRIYYLVITYSVYIYIHVIYDITYVELFLMLLSTPPSRMYKNCLSILKTPRAYFLRRKKLPPGIWLSNHLLKTRECTYYLLLRRVKIGINNCSKRLQSQNSHLSLMFTMI